MGLFSKSSDAGTALFADQFEPEGEGYLYRKSRKGATIAVTETEMEDFVTAYTRQVRWLIWGSASAIMLAIALLVWFTPDFMHKHENVSIWALSIPLIVAILVGQRWAWNRPMRVLAGRKAVGKARSSQEMRRLNFEKLSYGQLGSGAVVAGLIVLRAFQDGPLLRAGNLVWLVLATALMTVVAVQAFRKWMFEQER